MNKHLHQRAAEHTKQSSSNGKHFINEYCSVPKDLDRHFSVLEKCMNKFDCLVHEMLLLRFITYSVSWQHLKLSGMELECKCFDGNVSLH